MNNKSRREEFFSDAAQDDKVIVIVNSNQIQNNDRSPSRSRFEISESESNSRAITQSSRNQVNFINFYNCEKSDHYSRNCRHLKKMNSNSFVREIEKNVSSQENSESKSRKE
jgi:hypothetical protein